MPVFEFLASHPRQRPAGGEIVRCAPTDLVRTIITSIKPWFLCSRFDLPRGRQLGTAANKLVEAQVHRLWVTDEGERPVSVLSLTDVIRAVLG